MGWAIFGAGVFVFLAAIIVCATIARVYELKTGYEPPVKPAREQKKNPEGPDAAGRHRADEEESPVPAEEEPAAPAEPTEEQIKDIIDAFLNSTRTDAD